MERFTTRMTNEMIDEIISSKNPSVMFNL